MKGKEKGRQGKKREENKKGRRYCGAPRLFLGGLTHVLAGTEDLGQSAESHSESGTGYNHGEKCDTIGWFLRTQIYTSVYSWIYEFELI